MTHPQVAHNPATPSPPLTDPTEQAFVHVNSARLHYQVTGTGPPVVMLHGLSGSTRWWSRNVDALAQRFRVYRVDLVGFGRSRGQRFGLHTAAEILVAWLDQLAIERVHLVGHSMGGYVAADLAARFPERVDRLVLVDAAAIPFNRTYLHDALGLVRALRHVPFNFYPVLAADAWLSGPLTLVQALREIVAGDLSAELAGIHAPVLVVWGEHDTVIPPSIGERLAATLPNAQWALIRGAGHNPMWDQPAVFNQLVADFLSPTHHPAEGRAA